jgi:mRNA interferase RelE/StbE
MIEKPTALYIHKKPCAILNASIKRPQSVFLDKIDTVATNVFAYPHIALTGNLSKFFKLRVGAYRVFYTLERPATTLTVHAIGHRREVYKG